MSLNYRPESKEVPAPLMKPGSTIPLLAVLALTLSAASCERAPTADPDASVDAGADTPVTSNGHPACIIEWFADQELFEKTTFTYDAEERLASETTEDAAGEIGERLTYSYDAQGRLATRTTDYGGDGSIDRRTDYTYGGNGKLEREDIDYTGDGVADGVKTYTYDGAGRLREEDYVTVSDGRSNLKTEYIYDEDTDLLTTEQVYHFGATAPDEIRTFSYNGQQQLVSVYEELGIGMQREENPKPSQWVYFRTEYDYDDDGNRIRENVDFGADSILDQVKNFAYDAGGELVREALDKGADGTEDEIVTITYDEHGRELERTKDTNGDGAVEERVKHDYSCWY